MRTMRRLVALAMLLIATVVPPAGAQEEVDLVQGFADAIGFSWDPLPEAATFIDPAGDLFTLGDDVPTGPEYVDLLQTSQFGLTMSDEAFQALFGDDGALACDRPEVACPTYEVQTDPFAEVAIVVGFQLAAAPELAGGETLTVAVLANDDDFPTAEDPRPNSPFVDTNKAWRVDLTADSDSVQFLQIVTGPYEEFQTDARVLLAGDVLWFVIPPVEFPLDATIIGWRGHSSDDPAADVDGEAADPAITVPVAPTGGLIAGAEETTTTVAEETTTTTVAEETTTIPVEETTTTSAAEETTTTSSTVAEADDDGISPLVYVLIGIALALLAVALFFLWPRRKCQKEHEAWQAALAACQVARAAAERAKAEADRLQAELERLRADYPPLGYDQSDAPFTETNRGETISALDMALVAWDNKTRQPPVSEASGAASRDDIADQAAAQRERLREEYRRMKARESELVVELANAEAVARDAAAKAEKACADAEAAELVYRRCMGEVVPPPAVPGGEGSAEPPPPVTPPPPLG